MRTRELEAGLALREQIEASAGARGDLYLEMLLMAGKLDEPFNMGKDEASLGWSYGKAGALFSAIMTVLTESSPKAVVVQTLLKEYAARSYSFRYDNDKGQEKIYSQIAKGLAPIRLDRSEMEEYSAWAQRIGRDRVERIVSAKHRGAYDLAARVLGALAEYYVLSSTKEKALSLLSEFLRAKFPRHHAFHTEVKRVVGTSILLKDLRVF